jgi:hypothetical protein
MCKKQVIHLVLFLLCGMICIMVGSYVSIGIFLISVCSVIAQGCMARLSKRWISIRVQNQSYGECKEETEYDLIIENKSIFPIVKGEVLLQINNTFINSVKHKAFTFSMGAKSTYTISGKYLPRYCGNILYTVKEFHIMDYVGIFRININNIKNHEVTIIPHLQRIQVDIKSNEVRTEEWGEIRQYNYGDDIRNIHWKISAKFDETMIRKRIAPKKNYLLIIYENGMLSAYEEPKRQDKNKSFEFFFSYCYLLLEQGYEIRISWLGQDEKIRLSDAITSQDLLFEVIVAILRTVQIKTQESMLEKLNNYIQEDTKQIYITPYDFMTVEDVIVYNREAILKQFLNSDRMEERMTKKRTLHGEGEEDK